MHNMEMAPFALVVTVVATAMVGCTSQQLYETGQGWQRNECYKLPDLQERGRCLSSAAISYDQYKQEAKSSFEGK